MASIDVCDFIAGWVGGAAGVITSHPLDTVKVRLQAASGYRGTIDCCTKTLQREGVAGFYKGMSFPLLSIAAYNAVVFGVYSNTTKLICRTRYNNPDHEATYVDMAMASMVAGGVSVSVGSPVDLIKIRLQSQTGKSEISGRSTMHRQARSHFLTPIKRDNRIHGLKHSILSPAPMRSSAYSSLMTTRLLASSRVIQSTTKYQGPLDCILQIYKESGIRGFYRGGTAMVMRDIPGYVIYFLPYAMLCRLFQRREDKPLGPFGLIMAGGLAGVLSWGAMHPMDTIKTRLQVDGTKYKGVIDCVRTSYRTEGIPVFFRGLTVNAVRGFPQSAALFCGYEMSMRMMQG